MIIAFGEIAINCSFNVIDNKMLKTLTMRPIRIITFEKVMPLVFLDIAHPWREGFL